MKHIFKTGDKKTYQRKVTKEDVAAFDAGEVHPVYATFALARDAEWTCRQFVLEMKGDDEEGIGTFISVNHLSPALVGEVVNFTATVRSLEKNEIICKYEAHVADRLIARGEQGQKILRKERIVSIFKSLK